MSTKPGFPIFIGDDLLDVEADPSGRGFGATFKQVAAILEMVRGLAYGAQAIEYRACNEGNAEYLLQSVSDIANAQILLATLAQGIVDSLSEVRA